MKSDRLALAFVLLAVAALAYVVWTHHQELVRLTEHGGGTVVPFDPAAPPPPDGSTPAPHNPDAGVLPPQGEYGTDNGGDAA